MQWVIGISFGELFLKGKNRKTFVKQAEEKIRKKISHIEHGRIYFEAGKLYVEADKDEIDSLISAIKKVFGIIFISPALRTSRDLDSIREGIVNLMAHYEGNKSFKVITNRVDKSYTPKSPELNRIFGAFVLKNLPNFKVDVHSPDIELFVDIRKDSYIYTERIEGMGGLPIGSSGKGMVLFSGGIDSPVAAFLMAKRGVQISAIHFHSYPFTSDRAHEKVELLAKTLSDYLGPIKLYSVNMLEIYQAIKENCRERETTIISRRFMTRIGEKMALKDSCQMLITGEALGQVASQTIEGLTATNSVVDIPILRPLIAMDKKDIIKIAQDIDTYETSILPYEDSCSVFAPDRPVIKPRISDLEASEENLDVEGLVERAIENIEVYNINQDSNQEDLND